MCNTICELVCRDCSYKRYKDDLVKCGLGHNVDDYTYLECDNVCDDRDDYGCPANVLLDCPDYIAKYESYISF